MVSPEFLEYSQKFGLDGGTADENGSRPATPVKDLGETEVLEKLGEIITHGYGRLEVLIRQGQITTINSQTTLVRAGKQ